MTENGTVPKGTSKPRKRSTDWSFTVFVISLCMMAFLYGFAANEFDLPPKGLMRQAVSALKALNLIDRTMPTGVNRIEDKPAPAKFVNQLDPAAGTELVLVTGWPNRGRCQKYPCLASVIDRSGKILRSWPAPLDELFSDTKEFSGDVKPSSFYPIGLGMLHDGSLVATFHGTNVYPYAVGIARIDPNGKVLWKHLDGAHHWIHIGADERIYAPVQVRRRMKNVGDNAVELRCPDIVYDEGVRIYRPDGSVERTLMLSDILVANGYPGLIYSVRDDCDPLHINSVDIVTPEIAKNIPGATSGDLLISLREQSAIVLLDPVSSKIKRMIVGRSAAQHSARFLPDGTVLMFDNQGGSRSLGGSRILRVNLVDGSAQTVFPTDASGPVLPFFNFDGGTVTPSPDGKRAMIASKHEARDIEIDLATGKPLWTMLHVADSGSAGGKPEAAYFNAYGNYYLTKEQLAALHLQ
ncbi:arylsulfotransferase family protein [Sphingomonas daechungensis]|uniref:arylsulfotransferase family protein n=1 Tax=Sphingomonas daechungensis TaxID=1176646 RepID=UPI0037845AD1